MNATKKAVLAVHGEVLRNPLRQAIGTMFRPLRGGLVFVWWRTGRIAITNVFVPVDIDILWLDEAGRVVSMTQRFRSGAFHTVNSVPARYVIELPAGTIERTRTQCGDRVACSEGVWSSAPSQRSVRV